MKNPVAILNNDDQPYTEEWRGVKYTIPAGKAIMMSRRDAANFIGTYSGADPEDPSLPRKKALTIVPTDKARIVAKYDQQLPDGDAKFISNFDGKEFPTQAALDAHLNTLTDKQLKLEPVPAALDEEVTCPFCLKKMKGKQGLVVHLKSCGKEDKNDSTVDSIVADQGPGSGE